MDDFGQDNSLDYRSGASLLAEWKCQTREQKLERAVMVLMEELNKMHIECTSIDLSKNIDNEEIFCSCSDAYRMGEEALK